MPLVPAICTQCGAQIEVDNTHEAGICKHCDTAFITEKAIKNYYITNNIKTQNFFIQDSKPKVTKEEAVKRFILTKDNSQIKELYINNPDDAELKYWYKGVLEETIPDYEIEHLNSMNTNEIVEHFSKCVYQKNITRCKYMLEKYPFLNDRLAPMIFFTSEDYGTAKRQGFKFLEYALDSRRDMISCFYKYNPIKEEYDELASIEWVRFLFDRGLSLDMYLLSSGGAVLFRSYLQQHPEIMELIKKSGCREEETICKEGKCYIATCVYGSYDCPQVWALRRFRDCTLYKTWYGRAFIKCYYAISPTLVKWFGNQKWFRTFWKNRLDTMVSKLHQKGIESTQYYDTY